MFQLSTFFAFFLFVFSIALGDVEEDSWNVLDLDSGFSCPPNDVISPCLCHPLPPIPTVHCSGIRSLKTVSRALENTFDDNPIPYLKILNCHLMGLPSRAFFNLNITRLQIRDSNLTFMAPDAFDGLESLVLLVLSNLTLYEFPTEPLSRLPSLLVLSLMGNKLSKLTQDDLRDLSGIRHFGLRDNRLASIERGAFPPGLVTLSLSSNHLMNLNKTVRHMPHLETLYLDSNRLTTIEGELEGLLNLKHLYLSNNLIGTIANAFQGLHSLKILDLQFNSITHIGDCLNYLSQLQSLNLSRNSLYSLDPNAFRGLTALENLDLSGNRLTELNGALETLPNLVSMDLSKNLISNFTFEEIENMVKLKVLDLDKNLLQLAGGPLGENVSTIPLQMLFISMNRVEGLGEFLRHFPQLEVLDISWNFIPRLWTRNFEATTRLEYINVRGNPLACDLHQLHVLHELEKRPIEIEGRPDCYILPNLLRK